MVNGPQGMLELAIEKNPRFTISDDPFYIIKGINGPWLIVCMYVHLLFNG